MPNPNVARNVWFVREFPFQPEGRANVLLGQVFRWRVTFTLASIPSGVSRELAYLSGQQLFPPMYF